MIRNQRLLSIALITVVVVGTLTLFMLRPDASHVFKQYVSSRPPESLRILEFERHGFIEWTALFHFEIVPDDFSKLLKCTNPTLLGTNEVDTTGFASLALQLVKKHLPNTDFARDYETYTFMPTNVVIEDYLVINRKHSEGYIVVVRY